MKTRQHQGIQTFCSGAAIRNIRKRLLYQVLSIIVLLLPARFALAESHPSEQIMPVHKLEANITDEEIRMIKQEFPLVTGVAKAYEQAVYSTVSFFPELKNTPIIFVHTKTRWPLTSQPFFSDILKPYGKRCYRIIISEESSPNLEPVLLKNLPFNAQIGALGHELGHIADYQKKTGIEMMGLGLLYWTGYSRKKVEQRADRLAIDHGLGYQLYEWSSHVRKVMGDNDWVISNRAFKNTYTSPTSILAIIKLSPLYQDIN